MRSYTLSLLLSLLACLGLSAQTLSSPDGNYIFTFSRDASGRLFYTVDYKGQPIVGRSEMGIDIDNRLFESALGIPRDDYGVWTENLKFESEQRIEKDTTWTPLYGENATIRDHYKQLTLHFTKGARQENTSADAYDKHQEYLFDIVVRAYNEGVAFRYHFPEATNGLFLNITGERTEFAVPEGSEAFYEEWAQGPFLIKRISRAAVDDARWFESERPLLLKTPGGAYLCLLEAAMNDYARGKFRLSAAGTLQVAMYSGVEVMSPYSTPWRVIMAGDRAAGIVNNKEIVLNLNEPCRIADPSWIRPGKAYRIGNLRREPIMQGIQFAKERHFQFVELDARWYGPEMSMASSALKESPERDFTIKEVCDSARSAGLGVWVYVNQRALYRQLDEILDLYRQWGVSGIKFGFVQVGNQMWSTWLHNAVAKCAAHGLMVDIHDEYRPTGISRTYPNLLTQEGIGGNEEMPDAWHNTILPFTRYICGPADYTPSYFNRRIKNTRAHQLAMAVVYYSPLQFLFWYDSPDDYHDEPEIAFWEDIPTVFDESICLDGEPGKYIVQARRAGDVWYIGVMNGLEGRDVEIDIAQLRLHGKRLTAQIFSDGESKRVECATRKVKATDRLRFHLLPSGGVAIKITTHIN